MSVGVGRVTLTLVVSGRVGRASRERMALAEVERCDGVGGGVGGGKAANGGIAMRHWLVWWCGMGCLRLAANDG